MRRGKAATPQEIIELWESEQARIDPGFVIVFVGVFRE
jgi:hypothetical protein